MKVIASYNLKGGVGKTTAAVNLAYLSARQGRRTLLWDLDPQGAATYLFRVKPRVKGGSPKLVGGSRPMLDAIKATDFEHLDLLPADFTYRHMDIDLNERPKPQRTLRRLLSPLSAEFDVVMLDTPPSLSLVSENVLRASDLVLVPLIPTVLSVRTFEQLATFTRELKGRKPKLRGYFSMLDR
ncbi:MAG: AAA family ATPase, partial [Microlunatus sp.]|nr:AAA family ATPase [Microlunatus sp.]